MYAPTTKRELAREYAPDLKPESAVKRLNRWMHHHETLMNALRKTGCHETQKKISGRQKKLIYRYLGIP